MDSEDERSDERRSEDVRNLAVEAVSAAADLIGRPTVGLRWDEPSALEGMTVGALAAHLLRAAGSTIAYLDRTPPDRHVDPEVLTPVTYFHAAIDSPIHGRIKEVSADEATLGHGATAEAMRHLVDVLRNRLRTEPADRMLAALGGRMISLDDFCRTRLIEVLVHLDDLAVSVDDERPHTDPAAIAIVIDILVGIARNVHGDWSVLHALSRAERLDRSVFPVV